MLFGILMFLRLSILKESKNSDLYEKSYKSQLKKLKANTRLFFFSFIKDGYNLTSFFRKAYEYLGRK